MPKFIKVTHDKTGNALYIRPEEISYVEENIHRDRKAIVYFKDGTDISIRDYAEILVAKLEEG